MGLSATYVSKVSGVETLTGPYVSPSDATVTIDQLTESGTLTAATPVPVTKEAAFVLTMSGGTGSINLASLPGKTPEETIDMTGLKVQILKYRAKSTNANKITIAKGASNGLGLCASGDTWSDTKSPGQSGLHVLEDAGPDVASGARIFDVTGTGAQQLEVHIVCG